MSATDRHEYAIKKTGEINQVVSMLFEEIRSYLEWANDMGVSSAALSRTEGLLAAVRTMSEAAFEAQSDDYSVVVLSKKRRRRP